MSEIFRNPWVRLGGLVLLLAGLGALVYCLGGVVTPFAAAFAIAYLLNPLVNGMERFFERDIAKSRLARGRLHPRTASVGILVVGLVVVVVLAVVIVAPVVYHQVADTVAKVPSYAKTVRERVEPWVQRLNLRYPEESEQIREQLERGLKENNVAIVARVTSVLRATFSNLLSFVLAVLNLVVIPIFAIYLLYDMNRIRHGMGELVPGRYRPYVGTRMREVDALLSAWVRGQLTVAFMLGIFYAIGLTACGVPMGLLVGFVIGFFNLVPFMSYVLGLPIALLLSVIDNQSLARAIAVVAVFSFGQFVEGNFITPRIVGDKLGLHAVVIMLAVLIGGTLFGFTGMLLALPVTAALSVFWADLRDLYLRSRFYRGGDGTTGPPPALPAR